MLFETLIKLSGLLYLKYNFSHGMIVKVRINIGEIFHVDQDVVIHKDESGNKSLQYHPEVMEMIDLSSHGKIHILLGCELSQTFRYPIRAQT